MKKVLSVLLAIILIASVVPFGALTFTASAATVTSGTTGDCTWTLDGTTLTISGKGRMGDISLMGEYNPYSWENVKNVNIEDGVTRIGRSAFAYCNNISNVKIPNSVLAIGESAFYASSITDITIPSNVTKIESYAFAACENLTSVTIQSVVDTWGFSVFGWCPNLKLAIIHTYTSIPEYTFFNSENLSIICYSGSPAEAYAKTNNIPYITEKYANENDKTENEMVESETFVEGSYSYTVKDGKATITAADKSLSGSIVIPSTLGGYSVANIEKWAFYDHDYITGINLPDGIEIIGEYAFNNCDSLKYIHIPKSVTTVGTSAFKMTFLIAVYYGGCEKDKTNIIVDDGNEHLFYADWTYTHKYSNACDKSCNRCGATRSITHKYAAATCTKAKTCTVCKATSGSKLGHKYTNSCDKSCNRCKATRSITHKYKTTTTKATLTKNGKTVKKCSVCGSVYSTKTIKYAKTFKLSATSYTYNGKVRTPNVVVKDSAGNKLKNGTDYTVTYPSGRKSAGTYKVTVKMKGNYSGTKTLTFKIKPISVSKCKIKLSTTSYTYNGKVKTPNVTVKNANGTKLKKGTHYTVTYAKGRKNVGTYKVTIKMKGNYSGTKTLTFKINPPKTTVSKLTAGKKSITVAITKKSTQVTGYQIQYSTSKKFTNAKTKTITSYKTTKYTLKSLSTKKTYYVRVRTYKTVNGKKYYSGWSTIKYVKTK